MLIVKIILLKRKIISGIIRGQAGQAKVVLLPQPVTGDGLGEQTTHSQQTYIQQIISFVTGVLGFSGKKLRIGELPQKGLAAIY